MSKYLEGIFVTPQTPFYEDGYINENDLKREVNFCVDSGIQGIAALVLSAEFFTLSDDERKRIAEIIIREVNHRVPVAIGISGVSAQVAKMFGMHANKIGADAVIAMAPYVSEDNLIGIYQYFKIISENIDIPIIIQNAPPPLGTTMPHNFIKRIIKEIEHEWYIKEENIPAPHFISNAVDSVGNLAKGVFGGNGGRWMITEFKRGACGWITACEFSDILVKIYEHLKNNNEKEARKILNSFIPLIDMEGLYWENFSKEVLKKRGIISSSYTRISGNRKLDELDLKELEILLKEVKPFLDTSI